jgi:hypothetical protein
VKETAVCIVDETGKICREVKVVSHPDDLIAVLQDPPGTLSGSVSKQVHYRSGCTKVLPRQVCR